MREILFRGKRIFDGKWVNGFAYKQYSAAKVEEWYIRAFETDFLVIPETVCQFTGITDKNGRKIFEGDIVKTKYGKICKVFWASILDYNGWGLKAVGIPAKPRPDEFDLWRSENLEVIGNIYDTPELLEVKQNG